MNGLVFGRRRQGKSTLALRLAMTHHKTVFVFDPNAQFSNPAIPRVNDLEILGAWIEDEQIEHGAIIYRPNAGSIHEEFDELVELIWGLGNYCLLIDEAAALQRPHSLHPQLERLMRQAPRDGAENADGTVVDVSVIQTLHRPTDAHSICRSLQTDTFIAQTQLARDLAIIEEQFGPEVAADLPNLSRWEFLHCFTDLEGVQQYSVWDKPEGWYVNK